MRVVGKQQRRLLIGMHERGADGLWKVLSKRIWMRTRVPSSGMFILGISAFGAVVIFCPIELKANLNIIMLDKRMLLALINPMPALIQS